MLLLLVLVAVMGVLVWLGTVFQSFLFQRYRMNKNEAALRKTRIHEQDVEDDKYRHILLGIIQEDDKKKS